MARSAWFLLVLVGAVPAGTGCSRGSAVTVRRDAYGGILALRGREATARKHASRMMEQHCQGPYSIVSEQRVAVGEQTQTHASGQYQDTYGPTSDYGSGTAHATTTTSAVTELHLTYQCGVAGAAPPSTMVVAVPGPPGAAPQWSCTGVVASDATGAVFSNVAPRIAACYGPPGQSGSITVRVVVGKVGEVIDLWSDGVEQSPQLRDCVGGLIRPPTFPAPTGGDCAVVEQPLALGAPSAPAGAGAPAAPSSY